MALSETPEPRRSGTATRAPRPPVAERGGGRMHEFAARKRPVGIRAEAL